MSRKSTFWVAVPDRHELGFPVEVTPQDDGTYLATATLRARTPFPVQVNEVATIFRNEAGFHGRQWEMTPLGHGSPTQHPTLRAAAQALGTEAARIFDTRLKVVEVAR